VVGIRDRRPLATVDWTCPYGAATGARTAVSSHDDPMFLRLHQALDVAELGCLVCPCLACDFVGSPGFTASDVPVRTAPGAREGVPPTAACRFVVRMVRTRAYPSLRCAPDEYMHCAVIPLPGSLVAWLATLSWGDDAAPSRGADVM
jgi:hypothetical protein